MLAETQLHLQVVVSFGLSTTTDAGVTVSSGAGISLDNDSAGAASGSTGVTYLTFGFANGSLTLGQDVGVADGVGKVGDLAHYNDNQTGITNATGIGDDEGDGVALSTSVGDMSIGLNMYGTELVVTM